MKRLVFIGIISLFAACSSQETTKHYSKTNLIYARGFDIIDQGSFKEIFVSRPWQKAQNQQFRFLLSSDTYNIPDSLRTEIFIKTPVKKVVVFSSTHVGYIASLGESHSIAAVSGCDFVSDSILRASIQQKHCLDIGFAPNIDYETLLAIHPDVVFLYGLDPSVIGIMNRLKSAGIPSVLVSEFLEDLPLGKAEWIKFFSAFYNDDALADSIFKEVDRNYNQLKNSAKLWNKKPSILVGLPWKDSWYMSGGKSFTARFIEDAGGNYLWADTPETDFIPLDLESVFLKAMKADIWINSGSAASLREIVSQDQRFEYLPAFKEGNVFNNNLRMNATGGNDFWESGVVHPERILSDLIQIFHNTDSSDKNLYYYQRLN
ncbi:MAG: ABC transporter substrate-binding protein [Bacteroidales bacterium]|nr:ABC transporter substrate-binding protein [Bacteroidales bacterium]